MTMLKVCFSVDAIRLNRERIESDLPQVYEDQLPEDLTDAEYAEWFVQSQVDGVRIGPIPRRDK